MEQVVQQVQQPLNGVHMGNRRSGDQENTDETPNVNRSNNWEPDTVISRNTSNSIYCDSFTCPNNTEKRQGSESIEKGNNPFENCWVIWNL